MLACGLDVSTQKSGVCLMADEKIIYYTLIDLHKEKDTTKRMEQMMLKICNILDNYPLDAVYMEKAIMKGGNADTIQKLSYLAGAMMLYCLKRGITFYNPLPSQWRATVGIQNGRGVKREEAKAMAIKAVKDEYGIDAGDDVCEAILLCRSAFDLPQINVTTDDLWGE